MSTAWFVAIVVLIVMLGLLPTFRFTWRSRELWEEPGLFLVFTRSGRAICLLPALRRRR